MQIKCPKCGHEQTEDLSEFADEFSLSATMCEKCDAELAFDEDCHVSFLSAREPMAIAIDVVMRDRFNKILFVERKFPPELGKLALPGRRSRGL
jgi:C4-type Zn-finger protein